MLANAPGSTVYTALRSAQIPAGRFLLEAPGFRPDVEEIVLHHRRLATLIGFAAILMWSLLAPLTAASGAVPPFQLTALAFAIGGLTGLVWIAVRGAWRELRQPPAWSVGVGGAAPLISTALLIVAGYAEANSAIAIAALLITGGAVLASRDMLRRG